MNSEIQGIVTAIKSGQSTARAEVEKAIAAAKEKDNLHALLELFENEALARADDIDVRIKNGENVGRLAGIPYVAKDNFLTTVGHTTAAAKILENFESPLDATAIERLDAEGAILIGKANLDAFAHGGSTENSAFGPTKNVVDPERVAGGSSGGSAAIVAAGVVPFALGSDTGGSIRQPASFNGAVGYKPTYGMISRYGVVAMASSTDVVGPLTRTVADAELLSEILAGPDGKDSTVHDDYFISQTTDKPLKIGLIREFIGDGVDEQVVTSTKAFVDRLKSSGHTVEEVDLPMAKYSLAIYYIVVPAEVSSNLARYDGVRYGLRSATAKSLDDVYGQSRDQGFMPENKRRIMIGSYVLSSGYFDAYYLQAQKARTLLIQEFDKLFDEYDFLIGPTAPTPAFKLGENTADPIKMYLADAMTVPSSLAGLPALSLPNGVNDQGLPIGVQIIGRQKDDARLLSFAKTMEVHS
ncbi:MAG TPA: Asp-tRNA(Asn)/Glu-tRNA(Gln) amidotransferase subunit GatA [Candidatus Nanoperiomorbaceae bacterium]|nr:Asp-tRNA(Asn)/Glu-tRNA(Gln) amidotransferase subunit GatA [Candidatus Nanoperiomorbaceae bacterium]HMQ96512.1 Asp-tRNA(Asn)/Glu-tRNA(Gln) amidotransferase subunit GatA [Candidatus Nanoperiomorbaceae bacterium]HMR85929.1 Asp-tRNA(Asn)/Glu-tRNA(Gln) amidotransferase subunit GatA [Candidatus Nanoperiomorbaceae bacterium]HMU11800.1 Asp-tRNA(Asn)/Glu-tRNA(Gln) amidotransferase subunit GatA [Candidatus Nanoperiomorbaceae bacterium]